MQANPEMPGVPLPSHEQRRASEIADTFIRMIVTITSEDNPDVLFSAALMVDEYAVLSHKDRGTFRICQKFLDFILDVRSAKRGSLDPN